MHVNPGNEQTIQELLIRVFDDQEGYGWYNCTCCPLGEQTHFCKHHLSLSAAKEGGRTHRWLCLIRC